MGTSPGRLSPARLPRHPPCPAVPWFLCLAAATGGAGGVAAHLLNLLRGEPRDRWRAAIWAAVAAGGLGGVALLWPGKFYVEKSLTRLALPTGLIWLALLGLTGWLVYRRRWRTAAVAGLAAGLFTAAGNPVLSARLADTLQSQFAADPFAAGRFDVVCVLGGGVSLGPHDEPMVNAFGERAILAARLYHAGRTPRLLAAGSAPPEDLCPGPGPVTRDLWGQLAVPPGAIGTIAGTTTSEELAHLAAAAADRQAAGEPWGRIGLVSSAWHLPRAMRLAAAQGLVGADGCELVPLPADFVGNVSSNAPHWIPDSESLAGTDRCLKEWLARAVDR